MKMTQRSYTVRFLTPAFLGNAEQNGEWRTPPFKALLRQWWRVAVAESFGYDYARIRDEEGRLFGHAWLENDRDRRGDKVAARRSQVRIRLSRWTPGSLKQNDWPSQGPRTKHPEVQFADGMVDSLLYMAYGPLDNEKGKGTVLKKKAAIQYGETAELRLAFPEGDCAMALDMALRLMDRYGTLGGRSRNGWGSFSLTPINGTPALSGGPVTRDWTQALALDWPQAIGAANGQALIWQTAPLDDWKAVMKRLAELKIGLRTRFSFAGHANGGDLRDRHLLSYPVTKHTTNAFDRNARLPNSLRFKVRQADSGKLHGVVFHMPCKPPAEVWNRQREQLANGQLERVWQEVHEYLGDSAQALTRIPA